MKKEISILVLAVTIILLIGVLLGHMFWPKPEEIMVSFQQWGDPNECEDGWKNVSGTTTTIFLLAGENLLDKFVPVVICGKGEHVYDKAMLDRYKEILKTRDKYSYEEMLKNQIK